LNKVRGGRKLEVPAGRGPHDRNSPGRGGGSVLGGKKSPTKGEDRGPLYLGNRGRFHREQKRLELGKKLGD